MGGEGLDETFEQPILTKTVSKLESSGQYQSSQGTGQAIPVAQSSFDKGCTSTAANILSFFRHVGHSSSGLFLSFWGTKEKKMLVEVL